MRNKINAWYESAITTTTMTRRRSSFRHPNRFNASVIRWIIRGLAIRRFATRSPLRFFHLCGQIGEAAQLILRAATLGGESGRAFVAYVKLGYRKRTLPDHLFSNRR